jgi:hypothetical protein
VNPAVNRVGASSPRVFDQRWGRVICLFCRQRRLLVTVLQVVPATTLQRSFEGAGLLRRKQEYRYERFK